MKTSHGILATTIAALVGSSSFASSEFYATGTTGLTGTGSDGATICSPARGAASGLNSE